MRLLGPVLQLIGLASLTIGTALVATWLGFVTAGVGAFAVGFQLERLNR